MSLRFDKNHVLEYTNSLFETLHMTESSPTLLCKIMYKRDQDKSSVDGYNVTDS